MSKGTWKKPKGWYRRDGEKSEGNTYTWTFLANIGAGLDRCTHSVQVALFNGFLQWRLVVEVGGRRVGE